VDAPAKKSTTDFNGCLVHVPCLRLQASQVQVTQLYERCVDFLFATVE